MDYVGEVDMEQEEQAPAVGVLKTRCKSIFVNKRIFLFKQSKYDIILFDYVLWCVLFHASLKKLQKVNTLKIKALFINPAYQIVRMKIIPG